LTALGAALQSPSSFAAVIADSGLFDLSGFRRLGGASFWMSEYGDPDNAGDAEILQQFSPYHQALRSQPTALASLAPVLLVTRVLDETVSPTHSFKMAAALQRAGSTAQVRLLLAAGIGHDPAGEVQGLIDDYAARWAFLLETLRQSRF
jgi:prolyl oligopeptidase